MNNNNNNNKRKADAIEPSSSSFQPTAISTQQQYKTYYDIAKPYLKKVKHTEFKKEDFDMPHFHCNYCQKDITSLAKITCAVCEEFDLCVDCFCVGVETQQHKNDHAYKVQPNLSRTALISSGWTAEEELLLLEGIAHNGLGNWLDIAEHVGKTKSKYDCEIHYWTYYVDKPIAKRKAMIEKLKREQALYQQQQQSTSSSSAGSFVPSASPSSSEPAATSTTLNNNNISQPQEDFQSLLDKLYTENIDDDGQYIPVPDPSAPLVIEKNQVMTKKDIRKDDDGVLMSIKKELNIPQIDLKKIFEENLKRSANPRFVMGTILSREPQIVGQKKNTYQQGIDVGYLPLRADFDMDYDHAAEELIAEIEIDEEDSPEERERKLNLLRLYEFRLSERERRRKFAIERQLVDWKKISAIEKKRTKMEKELYQKYRPFARFLDNQDEFEEFMTGIIQETKIRTRIQELKEYRANGLTSLSQCATYDADNKKREADLEFKKAKEGATPKVPTSRRNFDHLMGTPKDTNTLGMELLSKRERILCSELHILPRQYMLIKDTLTRESLLTGFVSKSAACKLLSDMDKDQVKKIHDFFVANSWINGAPQTSENQMGCSESASSVKNDSRTRVPTEWWWWGSSTSYHISNTTPVVSNSQQQQLPNDVLDQRSQTIISNMEEKTEDHELHDANAETESGGEEDDMVTFKNGAPIKKPILPNFKRMTKKEVVKFSFRTSKIVILSLAFLAFAIIFSLFHSVPNHETLHYISIGENQTKFIEFSHDSPQDLLTIQVDIPIVGNELIYDLKKETISKKKNQDWKLDFQLQRNSFANLIYQKSFNIDDMNEEDHQLFINLANQTYTLEFVSLMNDTIVPVHDNHTNPEQPHSADESESEIQEIKGKHTFYTDYSELTVEEKHNVTYRLLISTNFPQNITSSFTIRVNFQQQPNLARYQVLLAALVLLFVYVLIVFELIHRTLAGMVGSFLVLSVLALVNRKPTLEEICEWMEYDTLALLFGMMIMVGIFSNTGFFEWTALMAYKLSKGKVWRLTIILCLFTGFVSAFLDNVTTILLVTPVTLRLCRVVNISPIPIIISEVIFSNIGGTATAIGTKNWFRRYFTIFSSMCSDCSIFHIHSSRLLNWKLFKQAPQVDNERIQREKEIEIWEYTLKKTQGNGVEENMVKESLQHHIVNLKAQLQEYLQKKGVSTNTQLSPKDLAKLSQQYSIHNPRLFIICCIILVIVIIFFFLESFIHEYVHVGLAEIAVIGAIIMLLLSGIDELDEVIEKVEWSTLLFFGSLFILMEGLSQLGLIEYIGDLTSSVISFVPAGDLRLFVAITLLLWVSAIVSAFIDNIPYTTAMIPVVLKLAESPTNLPIRPVLWALALGTCLGGNGTLIGASANVVAAGICENKGHKMSFVGFMKLGFPCMILSIVISNIYLTIVHIALGIK
ncbi:hypothetical protein C9374_005267 [Naegleria lovaniensis]|uniref:Uncharacterized protein n=1 Tax=Naegleria lovaniensis TaxID=51637 RepID=A0AA88GQX2_NAELO|nr:uncharacterized protein C9374_005267 [Naegleria lovaniensis]KAG2382687.1 hypothetical protein C9374_005267 [Naegleria lovaniensis]